MTIRIGILIFDDAEELDFVGPFEVFTMARASDPAFEVRLVAATRDPVRCAKGMRVLPDATLESCGKLDVLLVPGGQGTRREVANPALLDWIPQTAKTATWVTRACARRSRRLPRSTARSSCRPTALSRRRASSSMRPTPT